MTVYFTSDLHIGHKLVSGLRGFWKDGEPQFRRDGVQIAPEFVTEPDTNAHDSYIARYWDVTVGNGDTVFILGDTGLGHFDDVVLPWFWERAGTKHLVAGNHDPVHPCRSGAIKEQKKWLEVFDTINPYLTRKIGGKKVMLSHFPYESYGDGTDPSHGDEGGRWNEWRVKDEGKLLVHGHTHGQERDHGRSFHVGWDAWDRFVTIDELNEWALGFGDGYGSLSGS